MSTNRVFSTLTCDGNRYFIQFDGNENAFKALEKNLGEVNRFYNREIFTMKHDSIPENEVDILKNHVRLGNVHGRIEKLTGKLVWGDVVEEKIRIEERNQIMNSFLNNCEEKKTRDENLRFFEAFDIEPQKYLVIRHFLTKHKNRTMIQYSGNEDEIGRFLRDWKESGKCEAYYEKLKIVDGRLPERCGYAQDLIYTGRFNYSKIFEKEKIEDRNTFMYEFLFDGGIKDFMQ